MILGLSGLAGALLVAIGVTQADAWGPVALAFGLMFVVAGPVLGWMISHPASPIQTEVGASRTARAKGIGDLSALKALTPGEFEEFTRLLFGASGLYHDIRRTGGSGDGGIDLTMRDGAGNLVVVQCKRYHGTVSPAVVRDLYGVMERNRAREAYLVTTGRVSRAAQEWIGDRPLHVWGDERLLRYSERFLRESFAETIKRATGRPGAPGS